MYSLLKFQFWDGGSNEIKLKPLRVLSFLLFVFTSGSGSISATEIIGTLGLTYLWQVPSAIHNVSVTNIWKSKSSSEEGFGFGGIKLSIIMFE